MKATLEFDLGDDESDDQLKFKLACKAEEMNRAFEEIHNRIWRPYYKHGYTGKLQDLIDKNEDVLDAIELLHNRYIEILEEYDI